MKEYRVELTRQAAAQLQSIYDYISYSLAAPMAAARILREIHRALDSLRQMPGRIKRTDEEPWYSRGIRRMRIRNYYLYFRIVEEDRQVQILAVIYTARDQTAQLQRLEDS